MPRWWPSWPDAAAGLRDAERWLLPGECLLCRARTEESGDDPLVCSACRGRWQPLPSPQCPVCGQPLFPGIACRLCAQWPPQLTGVRSAVWLDDTARRAVHLLKYGGWWRMAEPMALVLRARLPLPPATTLIPVPLGRTRERKRGYNQSAVLAESLGRLLRVPVAPAVLARRRETTTQTALTPEERRANLSGAFEAVGQVPSGPVLVDDVFTTGATLSEAATALAAAGATAVSGVTFARAPRPLAGAWEDAASLGEPSKRSAG